MLKAILGENYGGVGGSMRLEIIIQKCCNEVKYTIGSDDVLLMHSENIRYGHLRKHLQPVHRARSEGVHPPPLRLVHTLCMSSLYNRIAVFALYSILFYPIVLFCNLLYVFPLSCIVLYLLLSFV